MIVFCCHCLSTLVAMATLNLHRLVMGKMKIGIYCYFIAGIWGGGVSLEMLNVE